MIFLQILLGRSPRRATTTSSSAIYYQTQAQCTTSVSQCVQKEETFMAPQTQQSQPSKPQQQQASTSICGSPCHENMCHSPTCQSPSCQSGTTGIFFWDQLE